MNEAITLTQLRRLKKSAKELRSLATARKNQVLLRAAELLLTHQNEILKANQMDLRLARKKVIENSLFSSSFLDRLTLTPERISGMVESLKQVALLSDPVGEVIDEKQFKNGLKARRIRSPLGVIFMIFESRPNVAIEAFSLAFKSGNVIILRGGKESMKTTKVLYEILEKALHSEGCSKNSFWGIKDSDRELSHFLLKQKQWIDVVVPRGGDALIEYVTNESTIPVIKNDRGLCHIYIHEDADLTMASNIIINAKTQRPGVCNAMETLLVHEQVAKEFLPQLHSRLLAHGVEWFTCPASFSILEGRQNVKHATKQSWNTEYLSLSMSCKVVNSLEDAISHIEKHGSHHSEAIITRSQTIAQKFQTEVDAAVVYWNTSTRFTDGFEMGLGGELGISTQKLHVRGPVGLRELTSVRWIVNGMGQVRG